MTTVPQEYVPFPPSLGVNAPTPQLQFDKPASMPPQQFNEPTASNTHRPIQVQPLDERNIAPPPSYNGKLIEYMHRSI